MGTISKITAGGATHLIASSAYGICSTAAATAAKTVSFTDDQAFTLIQGETIHVRFTNTNTVANPTLNVKGTGAKPIHRIGGTAAGTTVADSWAAGETVSLTYDTTQVSTGCWIINNGHKYTVSTTTVPNVTSVGQTPSLTVTSTKVSGRTGINTTLGATALTNTSGSTTDFKLNLSNVLVGFSYNEVSVGSSSGWSAGSTPTLGTAKTVATGISAS